MLTVHFVIDGGVFDLCVARGERPYSSNAKSLPRSLYSGAELESEGMARMRGSYNSSQGSTTAAGHLKLVRSFGWEGYRLHLRRSFGLHAMLDSDYMRCCLVPARRRQASIAFPPHIFHHHPISFTIVMVAIFLAPD